MSLTKLNDIVFIVQFKSCEHTFSHEGDSYFELVHLFPRLACESWGRFFHMISITFEKSIKETEKSVECIESTVFSQVKVYEDEIFCKIRIL